MCRRKMQASLTQLGSIGLTVNPSGDELTVKGESEAKNLLAMNLADEVIQGKKTPEEALEFYRKTVELSAAGKTSPYMEGLQFRP